MPGIHERSLFLKPHNMARLDIEKQKELEPKRIQFAKEAIDEAGYRITYEDKTKIQFQFKGETVTLYPYSGWHTGKSIEDGRGIDKLLKQIK